MAITKVGLENNLLIVDNGTKKEYFNASWCSIRFSDTSVNISDFGTQSLKSVNIAFSDFQDLASTPYGTEAAIATYLSDKIG